MANSKQALKRDRQRVTANARNRLFLGSMRTAVRKARDAVDAKSKDAPDLVKYALSRIDRAVSRGVVKRRAGSRLISRLATR